MVDLTPLLPINSTRNFYERIISQLKILNSVKVLYVVYSRCAVNYLITCNKFIRLKICLQVGFVKFVYLHQCSIYAAEITREEGDIGLFFLIRWLLGLSMNFDWDIKRLNYLFTDGVTLCIIIGDVHKFIGHCIML